MGIRNSSLTRVKPLFDFIDSNVVKLNDFLGLFSYKSSKIEQNSIIEIRYGDKEKKIPPSKTLLIWMIENLNELNKIDNYGVDKIDSNTYKKRKQLFSGDEITKKEAINLIQTKSKLPERGWYIFEGYTFPDIFIETTDSIYIGEAKRTEKDITTKTKWLSPRDQLIRHIDSMLDQSKPIYSFYILEYLNDVYKESMQFYKTKKYFELNLKHRNNASIERAIDSFIGFVFWDDIAKYFQISFPDKTNNFT